MNLWPKFFVESPWPDGFVKDLSSLLVEFPYNRELEASDYLQKITTTDVAACDKFGWPLSLNGVFSVKSYIFLNDGGICCPVARFFWCKPCPQEFSLFNWLAWKNKILTIENLAIRRCNKLPTTTCVSLFICGKFGAIFSSSFSCRNFQILLMRMRFGVTRGPRYLLQGEIYWT